MFLSDFPLDHARNVSRSRRQREGNCCGKGYWLRATDWLCRLLVGVNAYSIPIALTRITVQVSFDPAVGLPPDVKLFVSATGELANRRVSLPPIANSSGVPIPASFV